MRGSVRLRQHQTTLVFQYRILALYLCNKLSFGGSLFCSFCCFFAAFSGTAELAQRPIAGSWACDPANMSQNADIAERKMFMSKPNSSVQFCAGARSGWAAALRWSLRPTLRRDGIPQKPYRNNAEEWRGGSVLGRRARSGKQQGCDQSNACNAAALSTSIEAGKLQAK